MADEKVEDFFQKKGKKKKKKKQFKTFDDDVERMTKPQPEQPASLTKQDEPQQELVGAVGGQDVDSEVSMPLDSDGNNVQVSSWSIDEVYEMMCKLSTKEIAETFKDEEIDGEALLLLDEPTLQGMIPKIGPRLKLKTALAKFLSKLGNREITKLPQSPTSASENGGLYIFVDDSNIWIEGKKAAANLWKLQSGEDPRLRIDYGNFLDDLAGKQRQKSSTIQVAHMYGSVPPPNDSLWGKIREKGWEVDLKERSVITGKEKAVDAQLMVDATSIAEREKTTGGTIILVSGDKDFIPVINKVLEHTSWNIEVWMWDHAISTSIKDLTKTDARILIESLDGHIESMSFTEYGFNWKQFHPNRLPVLYKQAFVLLGAEGSWLNLTWNYAMSQKFEWPFQYDYNWFQKKGDLVVTFSCRDEDKFSDRHLAKYIWKIKKEKQLNCNVKTPESDVITFHQYRQTLSEEEMKGGRKISKMQFSTQCQYKYACQHGMRCIFTHSESELKHFKKRKNRDSRYKTRLCWHYGQTYTGCYNTDCNYAHGETDAVCIKCHDKGHTERNCQAP